MAGNNSGGRDSERSRKAADKIAEQRRRKTALEDMQGPRLNKNRNTKEAPRLSSRNDSSRTNTRQRTSASNNGRRTTSKKSGNNGRKIEIFPAGANVYSKQKAPKKSLFGKRPAIPALGSGRIIAGVVIVFFVLLALRMLTNKNAVEVFVDGTSVGIVLDKSYTEDYIIETCEAKLVSSLGTNVEITSDITVKKIHAGKNDENVSTGDYLLKTVNDAVAYNVEATAIMINGTEMAVVSNIESAQTVVDRILSEHSLSYIDDISSIVEGPEIQGLEFTSKFVDGTEIVTTDRAYELLNGTKQQTVIYIVEAGDSFGKIANAYGISVSELMEANPNIGDATNIYAGDEIKVNATVSVLDIKVVTQTVDRSSGSAVIVKTTYINGIVTDTATMDSSSSSSGDETGEDTESSDDSDSSGEVSDEYSGEDTEE
ncbi:MAG: LysM peptidoglycan-binding domain-containing protein [Clostridiales bacterium]|nr:LysM peptidoglycan-binding domain-containing protein [Clostridiales bacterium]